MINIILFGPPGVGKSTIGKLMQETFDFAFFDGDDVMTDDDNKALKEGQWNDERRRGVLNRIANRINGLNSEGEQKVVTSVALTADWMRRELAGMILMPFNFVLVRSLLSENIIVELVSARSKEGHPISLENFRKFTNAFESPSMRHFILDNPGSVLDNPQLVRNIENIIFRTNNQ